MNVFQILIRDSICRKYIKSTAIDETLMKKNRETLEKILKEAVAEQMEETSTQELLDKANKKGETKLVLVNR